jgi:hypothetical protein
MVHMRIAAALDRWVGVAAYEVECETTIRRTFGRFFFRAISQAWRAWALVTVRLRAKAKEKQMDVELASDQRLTS